MTGQGAHLCGGVAAGERRAVQVVALEAHGLPVRRARRLPVQCHQLAEARERQAGLEGL